MREYPLIMYNKSLVFQGF